MSVSIIPQFAQVLDGRFLFWEAFAEAASLSLATGYPLAVTGSGGNAKSAMMGAILGCFDKSVTKWVQSLHEEFSADDVFGGIDFSALTRADNPEKRYLIENSMFMSNIAVLEEGFDARPRALAAMKDVLTSGQIRMGTKQAPVANRWLVVLSNRGTDELSEMGPAIEALAQRFLTLEQEDCFSSDSEIRELLRVAQRAGVERPTPLITLGDIEHLQDSTKLVDLDGETTDLLAGLLHQARESGQAISPRSMVRAMVMVKASAALAGRMTATADDLPAIAYIPGTLGVIQELDQEVARKRAITVGRNALDLVRMRYEAAAASYNDCGKPQSPTHFMRVAKTLKAAEQEIDSISCPDSLTSERNNLRKQIADLIIKAQSKALEVTTL